MAEPLEVWELWLPGPGATGLLFARAKVNPRDTGNRVLVHAAPTVLDVIVRNLAGEVAARGEGLERRQPGPMSALLRQGDRISLEDLWPTPSELGRVVILPGGEAGILKSWWHADDQSEWRWQVEFYNHR